MQDALGSAKGRPKIVAHSLTRPEAEALASAIYNGREVADAQRIGLGLDKSDEAVRAEIKRGYLRGFKLGKRIVVPREALVDYLLLTPADRAVIRSEVEEATSA